MTELEDEWTQYLITMHNEKTTGFVKPVVKNTEVITKSHDTEDVNAPTIGKINHDMELIISTKTKVLFLNRAIDIHNLFWDIPVIDYWSPTTGVLKKQIKVVSKTQEEFDVYQSRLKNIRYYQENIIKQINNPAARSIKFKDERKITVGLSKKDILSYRGKVKNAFYNCFALIVRFQMDDRDNVQVGVQSTQPCAHSMGTEETCSSVSSPTNQRFGQRDEVLRTVGEAHLIQLTSEGAKHSEPALWVPSCLAYPEKFGGDEPFREVHIKVFNTGKMEIPGIVHYQVLEKVKTIVLDILQPHVSEPLSFLENSDEDHVLINSNFNCGFFVNRERFHSILRSENYGIESSYDPCSYPGVKCKFYYNHSMGFDPILQNGRILEEDRGMKMNELLDCKKYTEVSFMIFRTGSGLIVGNCTERILRFIFDFIKKILITEYDNICILSENPVIKNKRPKMRKRTFSYTTDYFENNIHHT